MQLSIKFHKILCICSSDGAGAKFVPHIQTQKQSDRLEVCPGLARGPYPWAGPADKR